MAIFRGQGGAGDAHEDITINEVRLLVAQAEAAAEAAQVAADSTADVSADAAEAAASAVAALLSETNAALDAAQTALDRIQTGLDRTAASASQVQTGLDVIATGDDAVSTAADAAQVALDLIQTDIDVTTSAAFVILSQAAKNSAEAAAVLTNQDSIDTAADATQTALDRIAIAGVEAITNQDTIDTAADLVQTNLDQIATSADATQVALDLVATNQDTIDTAADLVQTNQDTIDTAADLVQTNLDQIQTTADAVLTAADVVTSGTNATTSTTQAGIATTKAGEAVTSASGAATSATNAQLESWVAEAERLTADSYATEAEDVFVKLYSSDGDGTFTATNTTEYSAFHWSIKALEGAGSKTPTSFIKRTGTSNQALTSSMVNVPFPSVVHDNSTTDMSYSSGVFTADEAGSYELGGYVTVTATLQRTQARLQVFINGVGQVIQDDAYIRSSGFALSEWTIKIADEPLILSADDTVEIRMQYSNSSAIATIVGTRSMIWFKHMSGDTGAQGDKGDKGDQGDAGTGISTSDDVTEGSTNLFYTEARVSANTNVTANTAALANLTTALVDADIGVNVLAYSSQVSYRNQGNTFTGRQIISNSLPMLYTIETDQATDLGGWRAGSSDGSYKWHTVTDSQSMIADGMSLDRSGNLHVFGNITLAGTMDGVDLSTLDSTVGTMQTAVDLNTAKVSYTDSLAVTLNTAKVSYTDAAAFTTLNNNAALTTAANEFTQGQKISSTFPTLNLNQTNGGTDAKQWQHTVTGGLYYFQVMNDAGTFMNNLAIFDRSGNMTLGGNLMGHVIGTNVQAYDADTLKADTSDNLSVGYTTDKEVLASDTITPNLLLEQLKTRAVVGTVTLNVPSGGDGTCYVILNIDATDRSLNMGTNVKKSATTPTTLLASQSYMATVVRESATSAHVHVELTS